MVWEPNAFDGRDEEFANTPGHDETGRFIPSWHRRGSRLKFHAVTGYETPGSGDWYWAPKRYAELCAMDTYACIIGGKQCWISSEATPIMERGKCIGVVGVDFEAVPPRAEFEKYVTPVVRVIGRSGNAERLRSLTHREREVYHWLCEGKSNEEIGIVLNISAHTVKNHLERIFNKLGVENRISAALVSQTFEKVH